MIIFTSEYWTIWSNTVFIHSHYSAATITVIAFLRWVLSFDAIHCHRYSGQITARQVVRIADEGASHLRLWGSVQNRTWACNDR